MMNKPLSSRDLEKLSAYLDSQLPANERRRLEEQIAGSPVLRTALEELRQTRHLLRSLPKARAPRNFTLKPGMAPERKRPAFPFSSLSLSAFSALAVIFLLALFVSDFMGIYTPAPVAQYSAAPAAGSVELATSMAQVDQQANAAQAAATAAPSLLSPQADNSLPGTGMGGGGDGGTPQPDQVPPFAKNMSATAPLSDTAPISGTLGLAPLNPTIQTTAEAYAAPTLEIFPSVTPTPGAYIFTPWWIHIVEGALALVALGAGLWAILLFRRKS